ncbi:MAG: ATP-binding cassette domain-containing protein, partial [Kiloniellales bacterium]|nr:ATP-binding cassette domain-containing protein [Kiloniellales bacterium]
MSAATAALNGQGQIEVREVSKSFGGVQANRKISLSVAKGRITGLIGPNGSGKTTLFNSIVGYHPIDSGSIKFEGREISRLRVPQIARLGMPRTFQQTRIYAKRKLISGDLSFGQQKLLEFAMALMNEPRVLLL